MSLDSEFACEVVRIAEVQPHPNADRLELVRFYMANEGPDPHTNALLTAYTCVSQKGTFKPGDLAVYVSVDAVVPLDRPEFTFLAQRPDGAGKTHFRIRAARLRGVYSEGLLVPAPEGAGLGTELATAWGVTQHQPPQPRTPRGSLGPTAPSRRIGKLEALVPQYGVVSLRKAPHLFRDDEAVLVTEKIHGTNFRFGWVGTWPRRTFVVGSHRTFKHGHRTWLDRLLGRKRPSSWYGEDLWVATAEKYDLRRRCRLAPGVVFYGEIYGYTPGGARIQDMTYGATPAQGPQVRLFDAYDTRARRWLTHGELATLAADLELPDLAPWVVFMGGGFSLDRVRELAEQDSTLAPGHLAEGVVVESYETPGKKGKWVSERYRMRKDEGPGA